MATKKERALEVIEEKKALLWPMSDTLWDHPETGFHERYAAELYGKTLEQEGFQVERDLAGYPHRLFRDLWPGRAGDRIFGRI